MRPQFEVWKTQVSHLPEAKAEFEKWLFVHIARVLFADKAGELLMLRAEQSKLSINQRIERITALAPLWKYSYLVLCRSPFCARVIIYDQAKVQKALSKVPRCVFFNELLDTPNSLQMRQDLDYGRCHHGGIKECINLGCHGFQGFS